jgi:hypothetical protein
LKNHYNEISNNKSLLKKRLHFEDEEEFEAMICLVKLSKRSRLSGTLNIKKEQKLESKKAQRVIGLNSN